MIELAITVAITVSSILLFCYWFRYTCLLILHAATPRDYATRVAQAHHLGFQVAQGHLNNGATELDRLKDMLDRDYAVLACLMHRAEGAQGGIEQRMLAIHYFLAAVAYRATRRISTSAARATLREMSMVVAHYANFVGEAAASPVAA